MTTENLESQVERLTAKNAELLSEKKKAVSERDEIAQKLDAMTGEHEQVAGELHHMKVVMPRQEVIEAVAAPRMAGTLWRELNHHFDITTNDEGEDVLSHKDGSPVTLAEKDRSTGEEVQRPVPFNDKGIIDLHKAGVMPELGKMLMGSKANGSGAPGSSGFPITSSSQKPQQSQQFGMR